MTSIHLRPVEIEGRRLLGHWEGDLIKSIAKRSSVGALVEPTSGLVPLSKMADDTAAAAIAGFSRVLELIHGDLKKIGVFTEFQKKLHFVAKFAINSLGGAK